ncbi:LptF/LptG family permease [Oscillatoria amoena NRMC-F 0135]|nr:LptF/LptG family permease [Oscillatoria amoena NRMC-F 0135]
MKLLDRYILKQFLSTFIFVVLILLAVITVIDFTEKTDKYSRANLTFLQVMDYYGDFLPWIAGLVTPITVFIATVYVTARLAGRTEIIATLSSGVSFRRLLLPYIIGATLIAGVSFYLNGWVIPNSNKTRLAFEMQYLKKNTGSSLRNIHLQVSENVFLYLQSYNNLSDRGYHFTMERFEDKRLVEKLYANRIEWDTAKHTWILRDWSIKRIDTIFQTVGMPAKEKLITSGLSMDTALVIHPKEFANDYRKFDGLTINELKEYIQTLRSRGIAGIEVYEVELYTRFASPFSIFILTFMGVIVSSRKSRGGTGFQIAIGFVLSFIFILFFMMFRTFAEAGSMPPAISVWIPSALFGILSLFMYKYVPR